MWAELDNVMKNAYDIVNAVEKELQLLFNRRTMGPPMRRAQLVSYEVRRRQPLCGLNRRLSGGLLKRILWILFNCAGYKDKLVSEFTQKSTGVCYA